MGVGEGTKSVRTFSLGVHKTVQSRIAGSAAPLDLNVKVSLPEDELYGSSERGLRFPQNLCKNICIFHGDNRIETEKRENHKSHFCSHVLSKSMLLSVT